MQSRTVVLLLEKQAYNAAAKNNNSTTQLPRGTGRKFPNAKHEGFSLIELLIVVAIILIIASIAIPDLLRARMSTNEASAGAAVRTINTVQISYSSAYPTVGSASTLGALGGTSCAPPSSASACLIDSQPASSTKSGYMFALSGVTGTPAATYQIIASPISPNQTGTRYFCSFADAVPRAAITTITTCDYSIAPLG